VVLNQSTVVGKAPIITSKVWFGGDSTVDQLFSNGGAPFGAAAAWVVHGGYSNANTVLFTNGMNYFFNGGYYPSNNLSIGLLFTNNVYTNKGWVMNLDNAASINGGLSGQMGAGYIAGQTSLQDQDWAGSSTPFDGSGNLTCSPAIWDGFTNAIAFGNTNSISAAITIGGTTYTYTNPFYLGNTNYTAPSAYYYTPTNAGAYQNAVCKGTPGAIMKIYFFSPYFPGSKWTVPYVTPNFHTPSTCQSPMNYLITNSPASNGIAGTFIFHGGQNDWGVGTGFRFSYFLDSTYTNYYALNEFMNNSNIVETMYQKGFQSYICTIPFSPNNTVGEVSNGIVAYNNYVRTLPIPGVTVIDIQATNAPYQSTAGYYIDNVHPATLLQGVEANAIARSQGVYSSLSYNALNYYQFATNTLAITSTGVTNNTGDTYLVSVTAGTGLSVADGNGTAFRVPVINSTFPLKPAWRFTGTAVTATAVIINR
jgi:hypothetical protein